MILLIAIAAWIVCGILAYGLTFAHLQRRYPEIAQDEYDRDRAFALAMGAMGPAGFLGSNLTHRGHVFGFKWR